jgi:hypothetical protein
LLSLFIAIFDFIVYCVDLRGVDVTKDELISLTRDHFGRKDPDELLNGFFPVWAVIQFLIACKLFKHLDNKIFLLIYLGFFFVIAVLSLVCYILGCRSPPQERIKQIK